MFQLKLIFIKNKIDIICFLIKNKIDSSYLARILDDPGLVYFFWLSLLQVDYDIFVTLLAKPLLDLEPCANVTPINSNLS